MQLLPRGRPIVKFRATTEISGKVSQFSQDCNFCSSGRRRRRWVQSWISKTVARKRRGNFLGGRYVSASGSGVAAKWNGLITFRRISFIIYARFLLHVLISFNCSRNAVPTDRGKQSLIIRVEHREPHQKVGPFWDISLVLFIILFKLWLDCPDHTILRGSTRWYLSAWKPYCCGQHLVEALAWLSSVWAHRSD